MAENLDRTLEHLDLFVRRHIGPRQAEIQEMVEFLGVDSLERLTSNLIPKDIRIAKPLQLGSCKTETEGLAELKQLAEKNKVYRSLIGMGYYGTITPAVILRNILENPGWYTQYTPYQAEIAQGRLEALFNFQTMIVDFTGLPIANASLLDEATAAAEAMAMCFALKERNANQVFFVSETCHPQTIEVIRTRAEPMGIRVVVGNHEKYDFQVPTFGALIQNPSTDGVVHDFTAFVSHAHEAGALVVMAADLLSLTLFKSPGEFGADIAVGSAQRFGVSLGYGGPHAAYLSTKDEFKRLIPGRIVGASKDVDGKTAYRLALQTREQHIRRDKATSNICTSQVLLAVMASMYAVYHGPNGLKGIAEKIQRSAMYLRQALEALGYETGGHAIFDTLRVSAGEEKARCILNEAKSRNYNFRVIDPGTLGISLDEQTDDRELNELIEIFSSQSQRKSSLDLERLKQKQISAPSGLLRTNTYLTQSVFNSYHSETEMLRYIFRLQSKDLSLAQSMIPLGSCTMKLNATSEMIPVTWPSLSNIHPFAPLDQTLGYQELFRQLEKMLEEITGFAAASLQPNAGSQGEYAGLLVIRKYHQMKGQSHRNICLIPKSAHGTNPASAALAGMQVVVVECDEQGNVDLSDLKNKASEHRSDLAALMVTYPSTHGVFEEKIREICSIVHENGGQVYMDGANMNAQIGLCRPGEYGPDVCHLNLHKTFCIPHGGGGPGMGPILVAKHLAPYLPGHSVVKGGNEQAIGAVSAAPWGSSNILPISWMYISMMGASGLKLATEIAILSANYVAKKLQDHYPVLYKGQNGWVAHECIFDLRQFKRTANIEIEDVAKRLMDYGFHAPTISFPVAGTMMVEPTESESKAELDRFCEAMILIREEIREIEEGRMSREDNVLKNAPHTAQQIAKSEWKHPYSREKAVYPAAWLVENKFWPGVGRINNVYGDRNLVCSCS